MHSFSSNKPIKFNINIHETNTRIKKYGNQKRNFLITFFIICLFAIFSMLLFQDKSTKDKSEKFLKFYPQNILIYMDRLKSNDSTNEQKNKLFEMILNQSDNENFKSLISKAINIKSNNSFSLGISDKKNILFVLQSSNNNQLLKVLLLVKNQKQILETYKDIKIVSYENKENPLSYFSYFFYKDFLLASSRKKSLYKVIDNLKNKETSFTDDKIKNNLSLLDENRNETLIAKNLSNLIKNNSTYKTLMIDNTINLVENIVSSVKYSENDIELDFYASTPLTVEASDNKKLKTDSNEIISYNYIPLNTISYININDGKSIINAYLEHKNIRNSLTYKEFSLLAKNFLKIDIENDILQKLENETSIFIINTEQPNPELAIITPNSENNDIVINRLIKFFDNISNSDNLDLSIKQFSFQDITLQKFAIPRINKNILFGSIDNNFYIMGQENAVKELLHSFINKDSSFIKKFSTNNNKQINIYIYNNNIKNIKIKHHDEIIKQLESEIDTITIKANLTNKNIKGQAKASFK